MAEYNLIATQVRKDVLKMVRTAGTSHIGSNFSIIDFASVLYEKADLNKDKIIWSKGWAAATAYTFLSRKGIIPIEDLEKFCDGKSPYIGLLEPTVNGVECAGGSMGYGLSFAVGFALAKKLKKEKGKVYVIMSDGEIDCGPNWEAAKIARKNKLNNLVAIIDNNGFQAMGRNEEVLDIKPEELFTGWEIRKCDGHNFKQIERAITYPPLYKDKPTVIIAKTIKGKGVSFMEGLLDWHYKNVNEEDYVKALNELNAK